MTPQRSGVGDLMYYPHANMRGLWLIVWISLVQLSAVGAAHAEKARPLAYDLRLDLSLTVGSGLIWIGGHALASYLTPAACRWCDDNALDRQAREQLRWSNVDGALLASNLGVTLLTPVVSLGGLALLAAREGNARDSWQDVLFVVEAGAVSEALNQIVKYAAARERPYAHYENYAGQKVGPDERVSFYSAHTSLAFSVASAAGMVASLRGYRLAPLLWSLGMAAATFVGYMRVAADVHYLSDVLMGAAVGSLVGCGLPWLLHRPVAKTSLRLSVSGSVIALTFQR